MLILTNGLTEVADEGFLKVANSLIKRMKKSHGENCYILTYDRKSDLSDKHVKANKFLLNKELIATVRSRKEEVLYVPFPAKPIATALRIFCLSCYAGKGLRVVWVQKTALGIGAKILLKLSGAKIVVLSKSSEDYFGRVIDPRRVRYLKTGVDTKKFVPADPQTQKSLKQKYGFDPDRPVVLHVGHLQQGRNVEQLLMLDQNDQILLVFSTLFQKDADEELRSRLVNAPNVRVIEEYIPNIQEVYQLADVYFFPVVEDGRCIDVPLSCLEAAACNKPVVTTAYGEMKEFLGKDGFYGIDSFEPGELNETIRMALENKTSEPRNAVLDYDWDNAAEVLMTK